jgi:phosphatidylglycerol:prolipoprotein diacylglycerol transferase
VRWSAALVEAGFNVVIAAALYGLWRGGRLRGQLFHVYLGSYALFRVLHEPLRPTPRLIGPISPYQILASGIAIFALWRFLQRRAKLQMVLIRPGD